MTKVFIPNTSFEYDQMFRNAGFELAASIGDADLVQFTGGADVSPVLYGEPNIHSGTSWARDMEELKWFQYALEHDMPMAGICRGAQFLNVMCGGRMWQDVDGHIGSHNVLCKQSGEIFTATSTHHQMMRPSEHAIIVCVAHPRLTTYKHGAYTSEDAVEIMTDDIEAVYYDRQNAFCFQPHPEFQGHVVLADQYMHYLALYLGVEA